MNKKTSSALLLTVLVVVIIAVIAYRYNLVPTLTAPQSSQSKKTESSQSATPEITFQGKVGTVTKISKTSITIQDDAKKETTVAVDDKTYVSIADNSKAEQKQGIDGKIIYIQPIPSGNSASSLSDVKVGDKVTLNISLSAGKSLVTTIVVQR